MKLEFTKMHGLGNDFMVINQVTQNIQLNSDQIRRLSDRHTGVGFDQLLKWNSAETEPAALPVLCGTRA